MSDLYGTIVNAKVMNTSTVEYYILSSNLKNMLPNSSSTLYLYSIWDFWDFLQYLQYSEPNKLYHEDTTEFIQDDV